ncbi:hypothetical protein BpHYR1_026291 [Brachionus plicatilis]|uniref:Uncharacterized protein n=1 Tax=Brachionus plicatilis TaxID=10195 RepID=A0A3M7QAA6_BRAPC|nr:hypothetical protein BpHYR1_026291 [Brachionus plicatilis]
MRVLSYCLCVVHSVQSFTHQHSFVLSGQSLLIISKNVPNLIHLARLEIHVWLNKSTIFSKCQFVIFEPNLFTSHLTPLGASNFPNANLLFFKPNLSQIIDCFESTFRDKLLELDDMSVDENISTSIKISIKLDFYNKSITINTKYVNFFFELKKMLVNEEALEMSSSKFCRHILFNIMFIFISIKSFYTLKCRHFQMKPDPDLDFWEF